jgi:hypothetical protein
MRREGGDGELGRDCTLTDKAVVPRHVGPFLGRVDLVVEVHSFVSLDLAAGRKWRHLQVDLLAWILLLAILGPPALLLLLILFPGINNFDGERALRPVVFSFSPWPLARGRHCCDASTLFADGLDRSQRWVRPSDKLANRKLLRRKKTSNV